MNCTQCGGTDVYDGFCTNCDYWALGYHELRKQGQTDDEMVRQMNGWQPPLLTRFVWLLRGWRYQIARRLGR